MTNKQAAQEIYYLATSLRVYIREQLMKRDVYFLPAPLREDNNILSAIQSIQANAIQLGAKPMTQATTTPPAAEPGAERSE